MEELIIDDFFGPLEEMAEEMTDYEDSASQE